jgi:DNA-binding NtrC family response regulator
VVDIPELVDHLLRDACARAGRPRAPIAEDALELLRSYRWPGNVRELKNVLERAVLLSDGPIEARHLTFDTSAAPPPQEAAPVSGGELERIRRALDRCAGNQTEAAKLLGISRRMLAYRLDKLGVQRPRKGKGEIG